ncbi:MAG: hypothetical protein LBJ43_04985 [Propionibacteriaceae bacterium]|nr:hypothetical protein [Propionibacteriaceae bacterium]
MLSAKTITPIPTTAGHNIRLGIIWDECAANINRTVPMIAASASSNPNTLLTVTLVFTLRCEVVGAADSLPESAAMLDCGVSVVSFVVGCDVALFSSSVVGCCLVLLFSSEVVVSVGVGTDSFGVDSGSVFVVWCGVASCSGSGVVMVSLVVGVVVSVGVGTDSFGVVSGLSSLFGSVARWRGGRASGVGANGAAVFSSATESKLCFDVIHLPL